MENVVTLDDMRQSGGVVVDCAADPLDLRPAHDHILARVEAVSRNLRSGQPVVILLGEYHMRPVTKLLQTMLLDTLSQDPNSKIACGLEYPHDGFGTLLESSGFKVTPADYPALIRNDFDGQRGLTVSLAALTLENAPVTSDTFFNFCRDRALSTRFNDAAINPETMTLNDHDPLTLAIIEQCAPRGIPKDIIPAASNMGLALRNIVMVQNTMKHIQDSGATIYVHHCGADHVYGFRGDGCASQHSLAAIFEDAGVATIPVLTCYGEDVSALPLEAKKFFTRSVTLANLSDESFDGASEGEAGFIQKVATHSGAQFSVFEKNTPAHKDVINTLVQQGPAWLAELNR